MITLVLQKINGRLEFVPPNGMNERAALRKVLETCKNKFNNYVSVSFAPPYKKRTSGRHSQNSAIHGFAQCIAEYTGDDLEAIKMYCKKKAIRRGYPVKKNENGDIIFSRLDGEPIPESSANINTVEAGYLIEELQQLAAELDIILPPTQEEMLQNN